MSTSLQGRIVALAEGRQLEELAQMLEKEGATTLRYPMVSILNSPDTDSVHAWLDALIADRFDMVIFFTGEGIRRLQGFAERANLVDQMVAALRRTSILTRGPKPVKALKELELKNDLTAKKPTTEGVIATLREKDLQGKTIGVQYFSESNPALEQFLSEAGATLNSVLPYVYAPATDADQVVDLIHKMANNEVDVLVLTSSPQIDRLYEVASKQKLESELAKGLQQVQVAAVGPIVADTLREKGAPIDICPEQGFVMKNLVKHIITNLSKPST